MFIPFIPNYKGCWELIMIVYMATNKTNGKIYIGQTIYDLNKRRCGHIASAKGATDGFYFHNAIRKYGPDNFDWEVLDSARDIDELNDLEVFFIKLFKSFGEGYNLNAGGRNFKHSGETKRKISEAQLGEKNHMYGKRGSESPLYGKHHSEESRKNISKGRKGVHVGKDNHFFGKNHSEESKNKISIANSKPISINNTYFNSIKEASKFIGVSSTEICRRLKRKVKGYKYEMSTM